ncbi:MAG: hypothetical protein GXO23_06960 [Crenarchaeota archaeon]|nr:hypothetical protein [Thermoproteota archaeon]
MVPVEQLLIISILLPLLGSLAEIFSRRGIILTTLTALTLALLIVCLPHLATGLSIQYFSYSNIVLELHICRIWDMYAIAATLIILLVEIYSIGYLWDDYRRGWFFFFSGLMHFGTLLLLFAGDLITITIAWNVLELCSYALIGHWYRDEPERYVGEGISMRDMVLLWSPSAAAYRAIVITSLGTSTMLVASCIAFARTGSLLLTSLRHLKSMMFDIFIILAVLVPSAQVPFTEWLFTAMAGPTPASAMIHSTTLVNAGAFTIFKIGSYVPCPHGLLLEIVLIYVILSTIVSGLIGVASREVKVILAASTTIYVGLLLYVSLLYWSTGATSLMMLGLIILLAHGLSKACLFMTCGYMMHLSKTRFIDDVRVFLRFKPSFVALILASANLFGVVVPSLGFLMTEMSIEYSPWYMIPLLFTSHVISIALLMKIILTFWDLRRRGVESIDEVELKDLAMEIPTLIMMVLPYLLLVLFHPYMRVTVLTGISLGVAIAAIIACIYLRDYVKSMRIIRILKLRLGLPYLVDRVMGLGFKRLCMSIYRAFMSLDAYIHGINILKVATKFRNFDLKIDYKIHIRLPRVFVEKLCKIVNMLHTDKAVRDLAYVGVLLVLIMMVVVIVLLLF